MGPRKFGVVRKRSSRDLMQRERRTKARQEPTPRGPSGPTTSTSTSPQPTKSYASRTVTTGRKVSLDFLAREGFIFGEKIRMLGWEHICSLDVPTYPGLVREFYETLARGSGGFVSSVKGIEIRVTEELLSGLLRMPREGPAPTVHADRESALRLILGREDVGALTTVSAIQLSAEMRLLHNIVGRIFFPKIGCFDFISERDLIIMQCILEGIALNLPKMMMAFIGETITRTRSSLPYGMVLTLIFREFGVPIAEGETAVRLRHTDFYTRRSLERMGCQKVDGRWIRRGAEARVQEEEPTDRDEVAPGSPPATSAQMPAPAPGPASSSAPSTVRLDDDQMRSLARMVAEEMAARDQSERLHGELVAEMRSVSERLAVLERAAPADISEFTRETATLRVRIELGIEKLESMLSTFTLMQGERFTDILRCLERIIARMDQRFGGPSAQPDVSASSQPAHPPAPAQPAISAVPPRPPRPSVQRSGPASRTRSRVQSRSPSDSPPSVGQPVRTLRVYSRSSRHRPSSPIIKPSDLD